MFLISLCLTLYEILIFISYYVIILLSFLFIIQLFISTFMHIMLNGFFGSYFDFIISIFRIVVTFPITQFMILFLFNTIQISSEMLKHMSRLFKVLHMRKYDKFSQEYQDKFTPQIFFLMLILCVLLYGVLGVHIFCLYSFQIWTRIFFLGVGMITFLPLIWQLLNLLVPTYCHWANLLFCCKAPPENDQENNCCTFSLNYCQKNKEQAFITSIKNFNEITDKIENRAIKIENELKTTKKHQKISRCFKSISKYIDKFSNDRSNCSSQADNFNKFQDVSDGIYKLTGFFTTFHRKVLSNSIASFWLILGKIFKESRETSKYEFLQKYSIYMYQSKINDEDFSNSAE